MKQHITIASALTFLVIVGWSVEAGHLYAQVETVVTADDVVQERIYSPYVGRAYPDQVLFGDTHFHTKLSPDAGLIGTTLSVEDGYRFARGEEILSNTGQRVQLIRPLDFLVVTDHAEYMGLAPMIQDANPILWRERFEELNNLGHNCERRAIRWHGLAGCILSFLLTH